MKKKMKKKCKGQRVALRAKWSSHSNACGCLRHTFFFVWPKIQIILCVLGNGGYLLSYYTCGHLSLTFSANVHWNIIFYFVDVPDYWISSCHNYLVIPNLMKVFTPPDLHLRHDACLIDFILIWVFLYSIW